jgi:hypothetical protein
MVKTSLSAVGVRLATGILFAMVVGCSPSVVTARVVSDVRIANGWISVDRCDLAQVFRQGYRTINCKTENYYIGKAAMPISVPKPQQ